MNLNHKDKYIYFTNNWGEVDSTLLKRLKTTTPNNSGIWKNIHFTQDINKADYIISLGGLPNNQLYSKINTNNLIIFQREPNIIQLLNINLRLSFSYEKLYHVWTHPEHMQMSYDDFYYCKHNELEKNLLLSTVTSMRLHTENCKKRVKFIKDFCNKYPNIMDVYGSQWDNSLGLNYKGELPFHNLGGANNRFNENKNKSKYDGLKNYKYSLCIENSCYDNYFTEKITDCLLSWTIPIYFGCKNIDTYFPKNSYYILDINDVNSIDKLYEIIQKPITEENILDMEIARQLILDKYNIWPTIKNIIDKDDNNN